MKVSNSPSFGSKILYTAKLKKNMILGLQKDINVFISELEKKDLDAIRNANSILLNTSYGGQALCSFSDECNKPISELGQRKKFFIVETGTKHSEEPYKGIAQIENEDTFVFVKRLYSLRDIPIYKNIKGIGSCIMYAIIKMAQQLNKKSVILNADPEAIKFYRKIGMYPISPNPNEYTLTLHHSSFASVIQKLQDKFSIKKVNFEKPTN